MKHIITTILFAFSFSVCFSQTLYERVQRLGTLQTLIEVPNRLSVDSLIYFPFRDTFRINKPTKNGAFVIRDADRKGYVWNNDADRWEVMSGGGSSYDSTFDASRPITRNTPGLEGVVLNTGDIRATLQELLYPTQVPISTISGGLSQEYMAPGGNLIYEITFGYGRNSYTSNISSVVVGGTPVVFSNPDTAETINDAVYVNVPRNTNTSFSNIVTTDDGKTSTSSTVFSFLPRRYYGWVTDTTGISSSSFDVTIRSLFSELSESKVKTWGTGAPAGNQYYVYAYYATAGDLISFKMNGFEAVTALNKVTRNFTNNSGYTGSWIIYWTKNAQSLSSLIEAY